MSASAETVERLAKQMWAARRARCMQLDPRMGDIGPWEAENKTLHENVRCEARAALAAMGNPLPKCTSIWGHKFAPRYSTIPPAVTRIAKGDGPATARVFESLTKRTYEGDVCTRCGCTVNRPSTPATLGEKQK